MDKPSTEMLMLTPSVEQTEKETVQFLTCQIRDVYYTSQWKYNL